MTIVNLLNIWESKLFPDRIKQTPHNLNSANHFSDSSLKFYEEYVQASFELYKNSPVKFVNSHKQPVLNYNDLNEINLTDEEAKVVEVNIEKLRANDPKFYDGNQLLITGVYYDNVFNQILLNAVKTSYSLLNALETKQFAAESRLYELSLYQTGVLVPFITKDGYTFFIERRADKLFAGTAGFIEPSEKDGELSSDHPDGDLVIRTAIAEATEEFLGDGKGQLRTTFKVPIITDISFRKAKGGIGTIEFITPMFIDLSKDGLKELIINNKAVDADEHNLNFTFVPLDLKLSAEADTFLASLKPGSFLYQPMFIAASKVWNGGNYGDVIPASLANP